MVLRDDQRPTVTYAEVHGMFESRAGAAIRNDLVMLTNIQRGSGLSRPSPGLTLRYVGRGEEVYRIGSRALRLKEGQMMLSRQNDGAEIEIRSADAKGTLGLCVFLAANDERDLGDLPGPIVLDASCSLGALLKNRLGLLASPRPSKSALAGALALDITAHLPPLLSELGRQANAVQAGRASTRVEGLRRANIARSYLHSVTDRIVGLDELARAAGTSRFHLQRTFQQCFGVSPSAYHRRLRLSQALAEARRRRVPLGMVADEYGFSSASSLSHAYRRTFGAAPVWNKRQGSLEL